MALSVSTTIEPTYFTCDIPNITIATDRPSVAISVKAKGANIFSSTYYAARGKVTLRDLTAIIETHCVRSAFSVTNVEIVASDGDDSTTMSFTAIYCHFRCISMNASTFLNSAFFTTATNRLTTLDCPEQLSFYTEAGTFDIHVAAMVELPTGTIVPYEYVIRLRSTSARVMSLNCKPASVQKTVADALHMQVRLLQFSVTYGARVCRFFVQRVPEARCFYFWNVFNCQEAIAFPAETVTNLETDYSEAVIGHEFAQYDIEHTYTYETKTADLLSVQTSWIEQFLTSSKILLTKAQNGAYPVVLIKDYEYEHSDAPGKAKSVEFTWKLADKRLTLHEYDLDDGIFTAQYTEEYI